MLTSYPKHGLHRSTVGVAIRLKPEQASSCPEVVTRRGGRRDGLRALGVGVLVLGSACATDGTSGRASPGLAPPEPQLDLVREVPWPAPYASDPTWLRARDGDDLDRARLGHRESAEALLDAVRLGGSLGRVALAALAHASDRGEQRGALCELSGRTEPASLSLVLDALFDSVLNAPASEEDRPDADARCAQTLERIAGGSDATPTERDRAGVVLDRLRAPRGQAR